jgi:hypothetical protein
VPSLTFVLEWTLRNLLNDPHLTAMMVEDLRTHQNIIKAEVSR